MLTRWVVFAGAVLAALPAVAAASIPTSGGIAYVEKAASITPADPAKTVKVRCPVGTHVLGGGLSNSGGFGALALTRQAPIDGKDADSVPDDGWASGVANSGSQQANLTAYANCAPSTPAYVDRTVTNDGPKAIRCPDGLHVYAGGQSGGTVATSTATDGPDVDSLPNDAWVVRAGGVAKLTIYAVCGTRSPLAEQADVPVAFGTQASAEVTCPAGTFLYGGGASLAGDGTESGLINSMFPVTDGRPGRGWQAFFDNHDSGGMTSHTGTVTGLCGPHFH